ncbi:PREDICTED: uncharacterized protein LOC109216482 isoform X1 [Nicotiana attenuata]|uniref:Uncharacterized protein n=2 Tax=Nicotiana attenuata TaxID=49451 RepID=A0A1J6K3F5_NICAT|nr:PREDICTED: uncharacterized protein LOC109216482 isoform X1 [Nicotiana attenuata]XP_019236188.1 PREDICTED: uncharacterized protein LOC109216482 isoform X1 [Nicotiana attenuata]OIT23878.1 hypothetical protein A4A49_33040 [Nicotiana attenuata]
MDSSNESLRVDMGVTVGAGDTTDSVSRLKRESGYCSQCLNLEAKIKEIENSCATLQKEIYQERNGFKLLEVKYETLRVEKVAVEDELEVLKRRNQELEERMRQFENNGCNEENEEEDKVLQLMIENNVLECEKRVAESNVESWKLKCKELELAVLELNKRLVSKAGDYKDLNAKSFFSGGEIQSLQSQDSGKSLTKNPCVQAECVGANKFLLSESGNSRSNQVRKRLMFEEERGSNKRMAPSTPAGVRPANVVVIDLNESDDERTIRPLCTSINGNDYKNSLPLCTPCIPGSRMARDSPYPGSGSTLSNNEFPSENNLKMADIEQGKDNDILCVPTPKRRRASNLIPSDSDTDDDNVPICMLKTRHFHGKSSSDHPEGHSTQIGDSREEIRKSSSRRRLVKLSQCEAKDGGGSDIEEDVSDSEGESLGGFIVSSSDCSDDGDISNSEGALGSNSSVAEDSITDSEHISESDTDYCEIMSRIRRNKSDKLEWEFEGDMLAAFGKDPELCMRAVCVLYRQQTAEEKCSKETIFQNQRGFSQCDAYRGSTLAEFLTDGDPQGDMNKSVEELQAYDPKGIELCRTLATRYSKQLFAIYKNKEDPFFSAS